MPICRQSKILKSKSTKVQVTVIVMLAFALVLLVTFLLFYNAPWVKQHLPQTTINLITRMMGLLLTVIAVQMASTGINGLFFGPR